MFEGKPPAVFVPADGAHTAYPGSFADDVLLTLSWDDVVARLTAARDLRAVLAHVPLAARASFDAIAAEHLLKRHYPAVHTDKQAVNPVASGNGKTGGAIESESATSAPPTNRGIA